MTQVTTHALETAKHAYDLFAKGDIETLVSDILAPDVHWIEPETLPEGGNHRSAEAVAETVFASFQENWGEDAAVTPTNWIEAGNTIIAEGNFTGTDGTGTSYSIPFCHVIRAENGRIVEFRNYTDTALTLSKMNA